MRVLAVVLTCLACVGHGRRAHTGNHGPVHGAGLSGRVGKHTSIDALASLLVMRGGMYGFDDLDDLDVRRVPYRSRGRQGRFGSRGRRGFYDRRGGFGGSLPVTRSSSRRALRTTGDLDIFSGESDYLATRRGIRGSVRRINERIAESDSVLVQGGSLKTWSYPASTVDHVQVFLSTDGRPLDADVQLWQGPDNTPCKLRVYSENGDSRPFSAVIATPYGGDNTVAVRNVGQIEFPLNAVVTDEDVDVPFSNFRDTSIIVQGGALRTFNFDTDVDSVEVMLQTDGRPLNARVEMLQGPNNNKQVIEIYTEDGLERPFFAVIDTMGSGNVVRVVNTAPMEFPMTASVQPIYH